MVKTVVTTEFKAYASYDDAKSETENFIYLEVDVEDNCIPQKVESLNNIYEIFCFRRDKKIGKPLDRVYIRTSE